MAAEGFRVRVSDEILGTFVPIGVYWLYSGLYCLLNDLDRFRMHSRKEEEAKNSISKATVIRGVLLQQSVQAAVSILLFAGRIAFDLVALLTLAAQFAGNNEETPPPQVSSVLVYAKQFLVAMLVMDTWQYFMHRYMHQNKFLYRHVHSLHHRLVVPYSFGALYNHPIEGLLLDTVGGAMSFLLSGMSPRTSIFFFSFATIKTVDDHCGLWLPYNLFHLLFQNNTAYHDIHHQLYGSKYNFSQPFFVMWDRILGTYMPYTLEKRADGGLRARPMKDE